MISSLFLVSLVLATVSCNSADSITSSEPLACPCWDYVQLEARIDSYANYPFASPVICTTDLGGAEDRDRYRLATFDAGSLLEDGALTLQVRGPNAVGQGTTVDACHISDSLAGDPLPAAVIENLTPEEIQVCSDELRTFCP